MCGINGIFSYHSAANPPREPELLATREAMRARGPDGAGIAWSANRRCALGHRRLAIQDLSERAAQPMASHNGRLVVTFNGEIYNYPALRAALERDGVRFQTNSDTEVLLHLYARDGAAMVHRLRGMFAFAIWDNLREELFLARDPYGVKPLYTANDGWVFRFASQVKALLAGGAVSRDPEPAGVVGFHLFGSVPEPFTLYREIRSLPAGCTQIVDAAGPREPTPYTSIAHILTEGSACGAHDEIEDAVRPAVLDSVREHLLADVDVGIFLSAGIDSGAVLGLTADAGRRRMKAVTVAFEEFRGSSDDEVPAARHMAFRYGAEHLVHRVGEGEFRNDLAALIEAMDQPTIDGVNIWFAAKAAKEAGLKVVLSGIGGDELFAGYPSFADVPRWRRRLGPLAMLPGVAALARRMLPACVPGLVRRFPKAVGAFDRTHTWPGAYLLRRSVFLPGELAQVVGADMAEEGLRRLRPLRCLSRMLSPDPGSDIARVCVLESASYLRNQLLRDADWAGMAHGVEVRVPLADAALLRTLAPVLPRFGAGAGKAALARAPSIPLPDDVLARPKTGFAVPTARWLAAPEQERGLASRRWSQRVFDGLMAA
ncbi:MAG TPA: asparagine synthase (glutamine-hydrolyzing) [Stellaceae bacterium]|nr:asparagine synthase (glutamine-hydrolyzing) [Stellaceae bacterium]